MAKGLDVGTCFLVCASKDIKDDQSEVQIKSVRDAFLDIEAEQSTVNMLNMSNVSFVRDKDLVYIVGEPALSMANLFKREARRPLSQGVIAAGELDAERMLMVLLKEILGDPQVDNETVFYSVPANPIDVDRDVVYHEQMFKKMIEERGYKAVSMNEAAAIVYANCSAEGFTALATSCLTPGQKVITNKGFINIEDISKDYKVMNKEGSWVSCVPTSRSYDGEVYKIRSTGSSDFEVTSNHKIWIGRNGEWGWVSAKEVEKDDLIMQPWDNYDISLSQTKKRPYICYDEYVASSNNSVKKVLNLTDEFAEFIGFWLGDGHLELDSGAILITQSINEQDNIDRITYLVNSIFNKDLTTYSQGENSIRVKFYNKAFGKWLKENCYNKEGVKVVPWGVFELNDSILMSLLRGLIATDGDISINKRYVGFTNTSGSLAQFVYLSLQRLGCNPTVSVGGPRKEKSPVLESRIINSLKEVFSVRSSGYQASSFISWFFNPYKAIKESYVLGTNVFKVSEIEKRKYKGKVYDVTVEGDEHSFCLPGAAIHNCGAGMVNTSLVYRTMVGMSFSLSKSGDWIDSSAAKAVGTTATRIMSVKEKGVDLLDPTKGDSKHIREREAIVVYYKNLIHRIIDGVKKEFKKGDSSIELPEELPWVISGGTSKAINFLEFFKKEFEKERDSFPIGISEIRMAKDPLNDVARGLLIAAMNS